MGCEEGISVVMVTKDRLPRLRESLNALMYSIGAVYGIDIILWDNNSTDGTREFLQGFELAAKTAMNFVHGSFRVVYHNENIGLSAVNEAMKLTNPKNRFMVKMDDDVVEIPRFWYMQLTEIFERVPNAGYIAAWNKYEPNLPPKGIFERINDPKHYRHYNIGEIPFAEGDAAGGLAMTTREIWSSIGGFAEMVDKGIYYFSEDYDYGEKCRQKNLLVGFRMDCEIHHKFGPYYNREFRELTVDKYCNWLQQDGLKDKTDEERIYLLKLMNAGDDIMDDILNKYHKVVR